MERNKLMIFFALVLAPLISNGQDGGETLDLSLRHVEGQSLIEFKGGLTKHSNYGGLAVGHFIKDDLSMKGELQYERGNIHLMGFQDYRLFFTMNRTFFNGGDLVYLGAVGGAFGGWQTTYNDEMDKGDAKLIYGGRIGAEVDFYPLDQVGLTLQTYEIWTLNSPMGDSDLGTLHFMVAGGIKVLLN